MTIKEAISLIKDRLTSEMSEDQSGSFHNEIIKKWFLLAYEKELQAVIEEAESKNNNSLLDLYVKTYMPIDVYFDTDRNESYIFMPVRLFQFRRFNGIRLICPTKDQSFAFLMRANNSSFVYSNLEVDFVSNRPRYYIESRKVFFSNMDDNITKVMIKCIPSVDELNDQEDIPMPAGRGLSIITNAINMMLNRPKADQSGDNQSTIIPTR